jgi:L-ascorbate metabolism protein UlaG (beta-lactamase superfamily)
MRVKLNRRKFLRYAAGTTAVAAGGLWLATSERFGSTWLRRILADTARRVTPAPMTPQPTKWSDSDVTICWIGHATVLINFYGINILTDPVFADRCGVGLGLATAGPKRYFAPALTLQQLPRIDLILLSHAHMDHLDVPSLRRLARHAPIVTAKTTTDILTSTKPKKITELAWNETAQIRTTLGDLKIEAFEVRHWGHRWPKNNIARGYNGYILRREDKAILFGGDTADTPLFGDLRSRGPFDVAVMPIGAYQPWIGSHCNPEQSVAMANAAGARYFVPMHHQTFQLSEEPLSEPLERVQAAFQQEPERLALQKIGEAFTCPRS